MNGDVINVSSVESFDAIVNKSDKPVVADFFADWCGPCQAQGPVYSEAAKTAGDSAVFVKINVDDVPDLAARYGVRSIPTLSYFYKGDLRHSEAGLAQADHILGRVRDLDAAQV